MAEGVAVFFQQHSSELHAATNDSDQHNTIANRGAVACCPSRFQCQQPAASWMESSATRACRRQERHELLLDAAVAGGPDTLKSLEGLLDW